MLEEIQNRQLKLRTIEQGWRSFSTIENEWRPQYSVFQHRYLRLVLDGPSQTGKTSWARGQDEVGRVYEVNCAGAKQMNMRGFAHGLHTTVVADEATPSLIMASKKLSQAQCSKATLGQSPTMKDVFDVFVHGVKFIICANDGMSKVSSLGDEDKDWRRGNAVYFYVAKEEPMFLSSPPGPSVAPAREPPASAPSRA